MLEQVILRRRFAAKRHQKNSESVVQRRAGTKVAIIFSGLQDSRLAGLMTAHADVVGKPRREFRGIHNRVSGILWRKVRPNCRQVSRARPVTVLATNSQFEERWLAKFSVSL